MSYDIPKLHIPDDSPEARALERVMHSEHLSAEEAVRSILRNAQPSESGRNFIKEGRGMFGNPEDAKLLDEAVAIALQERRRPSAPPTV